MVGGYAIVEVEFESFTDAIASIESGTNKVDRFDLFNKFLNAWRTGKMVLFSAPSPGSNINLPRSSTYPVYPLVIWSTENEIERCVYMAPCLDSDGEYRMGKFTFRNDGTYDVVAI